MQDVVKGANSALPKCVCAKSWILIMLRRTSMGGLVV